MPVGQVYGFVPDLGAHKVAVEGLYRFEPVGGAGKDIEEVTQQCGTSPHVGHQENLGGLVLRF